MEQPEKSIKEFLTGCMLAAGSDENTQRGKSPAKKRKRKPKKSWNKQKVKQEPTQGNRSGKILTTQFYNPLPIGNTLLLNEMASHWRMS